MGFTFQSFCHCCSFQLVLILTSSSSSSKATTARVSHSRSVSTILIFGDSTVDSGNNNFIQTTFKSNFPPYGKDFAHQLPTGRFSNGRLTNDFIAKYLGVKDYVPPYLDPTLSIEELMSGVSFASAGSGFDPLTPAISNVIPLSKQLEHLREYKTKLESTIGKNKTKELINNALFFVSAGTNDFVLNYFMLPIRRSNYTIPAYMNFVLRQTRHVLQGLMDQGARRIGVVGLPPMGCLPIVISLFSDDPILKRDCIAKFSSIARDYNNMLRNELKNMQFQLRTKGFRFAYLNVYGPLEDMTLGHKYGFEEVSDGCCGTGLLEASFLCNSECVVCEDANKYVFWDSIHPSEKSYDIICEALRPTIDTLVTK
ncbi:hypothetical protein CASFOL_014303 [Castilleja foliolosa]|uniref:GDSL esterase/lipase n=1 Tax=Castilleja foliolosa TaxID=1961234 RepID=A0ABD3DN34_9LAMI